MSKILAPGAEKSRVALALVLLALVGLGGAIELYRVPWGGRDMDSVAGVASPALRTPRMLVTELGNPRTPILAEKAGESLSPNVNPDANLESTAKALRERVGELETDLARQKTGGSNSSPDHFQPKIGIWASTNYTADRPPLVRRIIISSAVEGVFTVHAYEKDAIWATDWGEVPLVGLGRGGNPRDLQPASYGLAMFAGEAMRGGTHYDQKLYLILKFDSQQLWTKWGEIVEPNNYWEGFREEIMVPLE